MRTTHALLIGLTNLLLPALAGAQPVPMDTLGPFQVGCDESTHEMPTKRQLGPGDQETLWFSTGTDTNQDDIGIRIEARFLEAATVELLVGDETSVGLTCGTTVLDSASIPAGYVGSFKFDVDIDMDNKGYGPYASAPVSVPPSAFCLRITAGPMDIEYDMDVELRRKHRFQWDMGNGGWVEMYSTHPHLFDGTNLKALPDYERLVVVSHGSSATGPKYFKRALNGAWRHIDDDLGLSPTDIGEHVVIVAPEFSTTGRCSDPGQLDWSPFRNGRSANGHLNDIDYSAYAILDELIDLADQQLPQLDRVFVTGQSGGGQLSHRYAMSTQMPDLLPHLDVSFVPINPGGWTYLTDVRPREVLGDFAAPDASNILTFYESLDSGTLARRNATCDTPTGPVGGDVSSSWSFRKKCTPAADFAEDRIDWSGNRLVGTADLPALISCLTNYDNWPQGLATMGSVNPYIDAAWASVGSDWDAWVDRFLSRDVLPTIGLKDTQVYTGNSIGAPQECTWRLGGWNRVDRANNWHEHVCGVQDDRALPNWDLLEIGSFGHSSAIFRALHLRRYLFGNTYPPTEGCP